MESRLAFLLFLILSTFLFIFILQFLQGYLALFAGVLNHPVPLCKYGQQDTFIFHTLNIFLF